MSRQHGKDCRVYLGSRDASGDLTTISISAMADVEDSTTFNNAGAYGFDAGLYGWEAEVAGFYDGAASGYGRQLETLLGAAGGIISVYDGLADALGDRGILLSDGILAKRGQPAEVASLIKLTGSFKATGNGTRPGLYGVLLHPLAIESATHQDTVFDSGASSANGGRGNIHITAATGTGGILKIQHSNVANPADVDWGDLIVFATASTPSSQTLEVAGTVKRYIRSNATVNGSSSLTYITGFARY